MGLRRRIGGIAIVVTVSAGLVGSSFGQPKIKPPQPAAGWQAPVVVHADQAHRETSLAINPKNEKIMLACAPSGVPNTSYNQSYFHISKNGGRNWEPLRVENDDAGDPRQYTFEGGDCDVAFDDGGTMYSADTWAGNLSVGHSRDDGGTWEGTPVAATGLVVDRPWLVGGPEGTVHVTYQDLQCCMPSAIWYTRSTDFGMTFQPTSMVAAAGQDGAFTWQGNLVVSEDGNDLYLAYTRRAGAALLSGLDGQGPEKFFVAASHDGGATWTSNLVAAMPNPMSYLYPSLALDRSGKLHVVFSSMTDKDRPIWYATSTDEAKTWTKPVPLTRGTAGWSPWVAVDDKGNAAVVWYGNPKVTDDGQEADWYFYWARIPAGRFDPAKVRTGTTTRTPLFTGVSPIPEFENIRLDSKGRMHIGASAYRAGENGQGAGWAIYYQRQR